MTKGEASGSKAVGRAGRTWTGAVAATVQGLPKLWGNSER